MGQKSGTDYWETRSWIIIWLKEEKIGRCNTWRKHSIQPPNIRSSYIKTISISHEHVKLCHILGLRRNNEQVCCNSETCGSRLPNEHRFTIYPHSYALLTTAFIYWLLTFMIVHVWTKKKRLKNRERDGNTVQYSLVINIKQAFEHKICAWLIITNKCPGHLNIF